MAGRTTDDDLMFGEIPDDDVDSPSGAADESEIDANNDETFGAPLNLGEADELEDYATQTAGLRLDDWDIPGCSAAPDPSELPLPSFDFPTFGNTSFGILGSDSFDNIWSAPPTEFGIWGKMDPTPRIPSPMEPKETIIPSSSVGVIGSSLKHKPAIPPMPKAPTLEELESLHSRPPLPPPIAQPELPKIPAIPAVAMSAEDLERRLLEEAAMKHRQQSEHQQQPQGPPNGASVPPPLMSGAMPPVGYPGIQPGQMPLIPPIPPIFVPCFPAWLDCLMGRIPYLPPGCPPVPAFVAHLMKQFQDPRVVMTLLTAAVSPPVPMPGMMPPPQQMPPHQMQQSHGYHRKPPGMPSGKTIEDLAFDQFAGFMSRKERQWLVKIQILQCQGTNNPYEDDYYYLSWRQKRLAEGMKPAVKESQKSETKEILNGQKNRRRERNGSTSEPRDRETTLVAKFADSLGIPSKSSTSNPRHLIRVAAANNTEEDNDKKANSQKKLRTLLLRLEAATLLLIECGDRSIALQSGGQNRDQLYREISERVGIVVHELFGEDFPKVLQVSKGRALIARLLKVALPPDMCKIIALLVAQGRGHNGKLLQELSEDVLPGLFTALMAFSRDNVLKIVCYLNMVEIIQGLNEKNMFVRDLLFTILMVCSIKKAAANCQLMLWLRSTTSMDLINGWPSPEIHLSDVLPISTEDVTGLCSWLLLLVSECSHGTIASQLAARLSR